MQSSAWPLNITLKVNNKMTELIILAVALAVGWALSPYTIPEDDITALANGATPIDIIPEPSAGLLALLSGIALVLFRRRRR